SHMLLLPAKDRLVTAARNERTLFTNGIKSDLTRFFGRHTVKVGIDVVLLHPDEDMFFDGAGFRSFSHLLGLPHVHLGGPNGGPITSTGRKTGGQISGYLQDKMQLTEGFTADVGLRYDQYSLAASYFHFSPRVNLAYRFSAPGT